MFRNLKKKQIIFVRHAKAFEREEWAGTDYDRPLLPFGEKSNTIVANYLRLIGLKPDRIIASPSARTRATADGMAAKLSVHKVEYFDELYTETVSLFGNPVEKHLNLLKQSKKNAHTVMIVGHNPDITTVARALTGDDIPSIKKGGVVVLSLPEDLEWKDLAPGKLKFIYYLTPQFLRLEELA